MKHTLPLTLLALAMACGTHVDIGTTEATASEDPPTLALACDCPTPEAPRLTKLVEVSCSGGMAVFGDMPDALTTLYQARTFDGYTWRPAPLLIDVDGVVWVECPPDTPSADHSATLWGVLAQPDYVNP